MNEKIFHSDPYCYECEKPLFCGDSYSHIPHKGYICMDCYYKKLEEAYANFLKSK